MRKTLKQILAEYGAIAVVVYLGIFFAVLGAAWGAINLGWKPASLTANVGAFTAAYLATKVVQPFRIAATLALTPIIAAGISRLRGSAAVKTASGTQSAADASPASARPVPQDPTDTPEAENPSDPAKPSA